MVIGLYSKSLSNKNNYIGVNNAGFPVEYHDKRYGSEIYEMISWFYKNSENGIWMTYNEESLQALMKLKMLFLNFHVNCRILVFGEADESCEHGDFLGFDCTGDSLNQSYLEALSIDIPYEGNNLLRVISNYFEPKLNNNYLFTTAKDANEYADLITYIIKIMKNSGERMLYEPEDNIRPIKVYDCSNSL